MTDEDKKLILVYQEAYNFLKTKVGEVVLQKQLTHYDSCKPKDINAVFCGMVGSLKNKQGYKNFIADVAGMDQILLGFSPAAVTEKYGDNWKDLLTDFKDLYGKKYKMDFDNKRNAWVIFCKGVLSCAKFLVRFPSVEEFDRFVRSFFFNEYTVAALPMLLREEIFGYGFPLACDFLKELGYTQYGKPDVHLKDIFFKLGLVDDPSDYEVFKTIVRIGHLVDKDPVVVDKIFWLIGSGDFYENNLKIGRQKEAFIKYYSKSGKVN